MKTDRERQAHTTLLICEIYKVTQTSLFTKQKQKGWTDTDEEGAGRGGGLGARGGHGHAAVFKADNQQGPTV